MRNRLPYTLIGCLAMFSLTMESCSATAEIRIAMVDKFACNTLRLVEYSHFGFMTNFEYLIRSKLAEFRKNAQVLNSKREYREKMQELIDFATSHDCMNPPLSVIISPILDEMKQCVVREFGETFQIVFDERGGLYEETEVVNITNKVAPCLASIKYGADRKLTSTEEPVGSHCSGAELHSSDKTHYKVGFVDLARIYQSAFPFTADEIKREAGAESVQFQPVYDAIAKLRTSEFERVYGPGPDAYRFGERLPHIKEAVKRIALAKHLTTIIDKHSVILGRELVNQYPDVTAEVLNVLKQQKKERN